MKYPKPELYVPTKEEAIASAKWLNERLTTKRVTSCNGIPIEYDADGNIKEEL